jgi:hypothetical protein
VPSTCLNWSTICELWLLQVQIVLMANSLVANAHNMMIRALNSIYLQAPYIKEETDIRDLLQYSLFWLVINNFFFEELKD